MSYECILIFHSFYSFKFCLESNFKMYNEDDDDDDNNDNNHIAGSRILIWILTLDTNVIQFSISQPHKSKMVGLHLQSPLFLHGMVLN
jgi:hypothetical protein